jgi:tyrosine-protein kinase Etk/Wzc
MDVGLTMQQKNSESSAADAYIQQATQEEETISLSDISAVIICHKWWILTSLIMAVLIGIAKVLIKTPVYSAKGVIQVVQKRSGFEKLEGLELFLGGEKNVSAEIEILNTRMIMGRVAEKQEVHIVAEPKTLPLIGGFICRLYHGDTPNSPWLGLSSYAWGGEIIQISSFDVPKEYLDKTFELTAGEAGSFTITNSNGQTVLSGSEGARANNGEFSIFAVRLKARAGTKFRIKKLSRESAFNYLKEHFSVKELGNHSGILELSFTGHKPEQIRRILDEIQKTYLRLNIDYHSAETEKTLKFLEDQLPRLKDQMNKAEYAYNSYRQKRGSLDLNLETEGVLNSLLDIENATFLLKLEKEELRHRFTAEHPTIQAIDAKLAKLIQRRKQVNIEVSQLPETQQTVLRLARDMEVSTNLYTSLLNTAQQLRVSKAGTIGNIRIIDNAVVSTQPIDTKPLLVIAAFTLFGVMASMLIIFVIRALRVAIDNPDLIEAKIGLPVYASVPHSKTEVLLSRKIKKWPRRKIEKELQGCTLLAEIKPDDLAIESLRSLRTTLHFALLDAPHTSLLITGSRCCLGKSFLAANLGVVLAQLGKRTVVVDADMRRGQINTRLGLDREIGISEYIAGQANISEIFKSTVIQNLYAVTSGNMPPNPSELLMHKRFEMLLKDLRHNSDIQIFDAPPVLAVSDAAIIGRHVGATLLVVRAGTQPLFELEQAVIRLNQAGVSVKGFIFNDINLDRQHRRYGQKGYIYQYTR